MSNSNNHIGSKSQSDRDDTCIACKKPIMKEATKCAHCGTRQDWRRYIGFSSTILALIVAFLSILTVAVPVIIKALEPRGASLHFALGEYNGDPTSVYVIATNSGTKIGIIKAVFLEEVGSDKGPVFKYKFGTREITERNLFITPRQDPSIFYIHRADLRGKFNSKEGKWFQIRITYHDFSLNEYTTKLALPKTGKR